MSDKCDDAIGLDEAPAKLLNALLTIAILRFAKGTPKILSRMLSSVDTSEWSDRVFLNSNPELGLIVSVYAATEATEIELVPSLGLGRSQVLK